MARPNDPYEIIAHRGYSARAPENTLAALDAAVLAGADAVEWDVRIASCGTPILFHDPHLDRTTDGVGPVRERSFERLRTLDAGSWFSSGHAGERIPALHQALTRVRRRIGHVYCEVKSYREFADLDRIVAETRDAGMLDRTTFISLDWRALERVGDAGRGVRIGYIVDDVKRFEEAMRRALARRAVLLDFDYRVVFQDPFVVPRARARGLDVAVWTVDDTAAADALAGEGVRRFTTNEVERLVGWRERAHP